MLSTAGMVLKYGWPFFILVAIIVMKMRWKNWVIDVVILERRGKNIVKSNDRAGMYIDKFTKLRGYKLMKSKETIPVVEYDWILHNNLKHLSMLERIVNILRPTAGTLFLFKYGSKQYKPIIAKSVEDAEKKLVSIKNAEGKDVVVYQYQQFDPRGYLNPVSMEVFDWDNMNFALQEMRASFERREKQNSWMKQYLMPIAALVVTALVCIVMLKFSMEKSASLAAVQCGNQPTQTPEPNTPNIPIVGDLFPTPGQ